MRSSGYYARAIFGLGLLALCGNAVAAGSVTMQEGVAALPDCARTCLMTAFSKTTCSATDADCLCGDAEFNKLATVCITTNCTVKETLTSKNITSLACGVEPSSDGSLAVIYSVFIGLAVLAVILRIVARILTQAYFWWDDFANLFGFIGSALFTALNIKAIDHGQSTDMWFVSFDNIAIVLKMFFADMLLYTITRFFVRASIILFYLRVFPPRSDNRLGRILQFTMAFNVIYNISFLFAVIFQCNPISDFWTQWSGEHEGHCGNANILAWVAAATGIAFDVWLLALPLSQLLGLNLHWKKKLMGGMMFFVGAAVMVISLVRLKTINEFTRAHNPTKDIVQVCLWSGIELDVGVICPCLPSFRLLLRRLLPTVMGTSRQYEMDPVSNATGVTRSGIRKSLGVTGAGLGGIGGGGGPGKILVENTIAIKFASSDSGDGRSDASVTGLVVEARASAEDLEEGIGRGR
ncbi:hypothetical protein C8A05DRAFT_35351 [Staphylotrichum tortipilum]|uniref:CFEM domain-containing protein n=1 Tax=Staphylotrichum tortipilum TaxID=2831512 RepID=A0AAN6MHK3_9PEZI|nr:hypothetical protein C8A05DRAFT_35351 [Staphylotrichum longicolle]